MSARIRLAGLVAALGVLAAVGCAARRPAAMPAAGSASRAPAAGLPVLPFAEDDFPAALARARDANLPLFVEVWAPW